MAAKFGALISYNSMLMVMIIMMILMMIQLLLLCLGLPGAKSSPPLIYGYARTRTIFMYNIII
jgi:hypothetical protein